MITLKKKKDIKRLRIAGKILAKVLEETSRMIRPGVATQELDIFAEKRILELGAKPSFKGYAGGENDPPFPTTLCTSVNEEVVHTPASVRVLKEGDIIGVDIGLKYTVLGKEYFVDMAKTFGVGTVSPQAQKLMEVTQDALNIGIREIRPGKFISDIGRAVQAYVEKEGFSVVRNLVGHGVGFAVHEDPKIPNYFSEKMQKILIQKGMVLAIEPMVNVGGYEIQTLDDGWTVVTRDSSFSAHFEHTIAVTEKGCEILTNL